MKGITSGFVKHGKVNIVVDGTFGSTGKGAIAARIAMDNHIDIACSTTSPNAGHTFYWDSRKYITHSIPVAAIFHDRCQIYFSAESVIDKDIFFKEMNDFNIDDSRVAIHPRAVVIRKEDKETEAKRGGIEKIASTQSGTGAARAAKIMRKGLLAEQDPELKEYVQKLDLHWYLEKHDAQILVETGQGLGLDINHGLAYPFCTSRSVHAGTILAELGVSPIFYGNLLMSYRAFPIRVGNPLRNGVEVGYSGPFFDDCEEITFADLNVPDERTTVTKRIRRISTFSMKQYTEAVDFLRPTHIFLNFINYFQNGRFPIPKFEKEYNPTYVGYGPYPDQISPWEENIIERVQK